MKPFPQAVYYMFGEPHFSAVGRVSFLTILVLVQPLSIYVRRPHVAKVLKAELRRIMNA